MKNDCKDQKQQNNVSCRCCQQIGISCSFFAVFQTDAAEYYPYKGYKQREYYYTCFGRCITWLIAWHTASRINRRHQAVKLGIVHACSRRFTVRTAWLSVIVAAVFFVRNVMQNGFSHSTFLPADNACFTCS